jgi:hypothetical protein
VIVVMVMVVIVAAVATVVTATVTTTTTTTTIDRRCQFSNSFPLSSRSCLCAYACRIPIAFGPRVGSTRVARVLFLSLFPSARSPYARKARIFGRTSSAREFARCKSRINERTSNEDPCDHTKGQAGAAGTVPTVG